MNKKVYAKQIPLDRRESLFILSEHSENAIVWGNSCLPPYITSEFDIIIRNIHAAYYYIFSLSTPVENIFPPSHKEKYTKEEVVRWLNLCTRWEFEDKEPNSCCRNIMLCQALTLMTGKEYTWCEISGKKFADVQNLYIPEDETNLISSIETEYFNLGTEWEIHKYAYIPENPDDIDGVYMYCHRNPRREIAISYGVAESDVILYKFDGYEQVPKYVKSEVKTPKIYRVHVREIHERLVEIVAENEERAVEIAYEQWKKEEFTLGGDDTFMDVEFKAMGTVEK